MSQFITNKEELLSDVINDIIPTSKNISFLVGYFYFSGFFELYKTLKDKEVRILIGLDVERALHSSIKEYYIIEENNKTNYSKLEIRKAYYESLKNLINKSEFCDSNQKKEAFQIFLEKIKNGTLTVKKTNDPNHAKLYIFEKSEEYNERGQYPGTIITGSSNLSLSGLKNNFEINISSRDAGDFKEAKRIFDDLWNNYSTDLINKETLQEFEDEVIKKTWIYKLPRPYLVYIRILQEYFEIKNDNKKIKFSSELTKNKFINLKYQTDAVKKSLNLVEKHDGAIISDVVGLGKSIIASVVAKNLNLPTIIICPPHLKDEWSDYRRIFGFNGEIYTSGSVEKAIKDYQFDDSLKLIIVDEAHKYRNELTQDYKSLHELCTGNKVVLLTATPFNNRPQDIFSMIKLFQIPAKSTIRTVDNLSAKFKDLIKDYKKLNKISDKEERKKEIKRVADDIRMILSPFIIRRSRIDLKERDEYRKDLEKQGIEFSNVEPPALMEYDLGQLYEKYVWTLEKIMGDENKKDGFKGARYKPTEYLKNKEKYKKEIEKAYGSEVLFKQGQRNLAKFMKRLLVSRFESSIKAFDITLQNMINSITNIKNWYYKIGQIPIYKKSNIVDLEDLLDSIEEDLDDEMKSSEIVAKLEELKTKNYWFIDKKEIKKEFINKLEDDLKILEEIQEYWFGSKRHIAEDQFDPKISHLIKHLEEKLEENKNRKIIIFTEFSDTADHIFSKIKNHFRSFKYTSKESNKKNKGIVKENFDAGVDAKEQKNEFDVLVATDAISEGYNLHRAGIVINYDIPYNPTRVIQRVGRINRMNKKVFENLYIYNYFPSLIGENEIYKKKISTLKIDMINALLGNDMRILTKDEDLQSFYNSEYEKVLEQDEQRSWDLEYMKELDHAKSEIKEKALQIEERTRIRRTEKREEKGVLIFAKKGNDYLFKLANDDNTENQRILNPQQALQLIKANENEKAQEESDSFDLIYQSLKQNLFVKNSQIKRDRGKIETIEKIKAFRNIFKKEKEYFDDLFMVAFQLDALIDGDEKFIRALNIENKNLLQELKERISPRYLQRIIKKARRIEDGDESIIISEELI